MQAPQPPPPLFAGLDLGQSADYSAFVLLERHAQWNAVTERIEFSFDCRAIKRWELGTSYTRVTADVVKMFEQPPLAGQNLLLDVTGVGKPVLDMLADARPCAYLNGVLLTGGQAVSYEGGLIHISKTILVAQLQCVLQQRRLRLPISAESEILRKELSNYTVKITPSAHEIYTGRDSAHDDLVIALALGVWGGLNLYVPDPNAPPGAFALDAGKADPFGYGPTGAPRDDPGAIQRGMDAWGSDFFS